VTQASTRIGVLSDTHNNEDNTRAALDLLRQRQVTQLIHCGDVTGARLLELFEGFETWLVRGNNDRDGLDFRSAARRIGGLHYMGYDAALDIDGHAVAACHGDDAGLIDSFVAARSYEWVFYGHSHVRGLDLEGSTRLLNPGSLGGRRPHGEPRGFAIVDLARGLAEFVSL
jgi:putative phosphoesterase